MVRLGEIFKRLRFRQVSALLALLLALPLGWKELTGFYAWLSPFILLNSIFGLKSVVFLNLAGLVVLVFVIVKKRWFCRKLCPVGLACDWASSFNSGKKNRIKKIPSIGKWLAIFSLAGAILGFPVFAVLDPTAIFNGFFGAFSHSSSLVVIISLAGFPVLLLIHLFVPGIWCTKLCPLGGLQDEVYRIKEFMVTQMKGDRKTASVSFGGRRLFLASGFGLVSGLFIPKLLKGETKPYFRPPGSVPKKYFDFLCVRCGSCIKTCPSSILIHHKDAEDAVSWMIPEISFEKGYCLEDCNLCSQVCPSGAITLFDTEAKGMLKIGLAEILPQNCLLTQNKECDRCKVACKYNAIKIDIHGPYDALPVINHDKCNGCGACFVICPAEAVRMKHLSSEL
ncbi:4Fe-4S binding protein [Maribellus sp. YY47]|uniref:4Fe-4S binding protein n=1 Tax=Maribellus sp. YY47 TaxID=2929486 RepID=UPI0020010780|nr:4Fe-4S binding protein [Maribellus sp. YY47]MCK3682880.1 4Fe-4S binding protein [Maribellus sp. YY47]